MMKYAITLALLIVLTFGPGGAMAAVKLRVGEHADYSRLVFDLKERAEYGLKTEAPGKLLLTFKKDEKLSKDTVAAPNILGLEVVTTAPLSVRILVPENSKTRDFYVGNRLVLDVFNPPGAKPQKVAKVKEKEKPAPAPKKVAAAPVVKPEGVVKEKLEELPVTVLESAAQEAAAGIDPHTITVTSTGEVGMAVFENFGKTWLIVDSQKKFLNPKVNGPRPELFLPFEEKDIEDGLAFGTKIPPGNILRGEGGGLLWRLVVSGQEEKKTPRIFKRETEDGEDFRNGTVTWAVEGARHILEFPDPVTGQVLKVVTVSDTNDFAGPARQFMDFDVLPSAVGLVVRPRVDDLELEITEEGVKITRPGGLVLASENTIRLAEERGRKIAEQEKEGVVPRPRIYNFSEWQMGGLDAINQNRNIIFASLSAAREGKKLEDLITLAKMYLSNARAAEALGFLELAKQEVPELESNPEFLALRGAAHAVDWKSEDAFKDLSIKPLEPYIDVQYWRAYTLADLGDWQQAYVVMPQEVGPLHDVPAAIQDRLVLRLAEVALRAGDVDLADKLLKMPEGHKKGMPSQFRAALQYLKGEKERQLGNYEETLNLWEPLAGGADDLYRVRAGLALTRVKQQQHKIGLDKAIDNLERLRYAWRGDGLEASINYWLGRAYFDAAEYNKGLNILREAATFAAGTALGERIAEEMTDMFTEIFVGEHLESMTPLEAVAIYEQFSELAPAGAAGDKVVEMLAEHLYKADLLDRAANLLEHQVEHRLEGKEKARVAVRTAVLRLLDRKPMKSLKILGEAEKIYRAQPQLAGAEKRHVIDLLRARAYSQQDRADEALELLNGKDLTPDVNKLRADIAWRAGYWDDAAEALRDVIADEKISLTRPLRDKHAALILNRAVALNLASDRIALANMREIYTDSMSQTDQARMFEVVTRPRQSVALADRETLMGIIEEIDLFKDFLKGQTGSVVPSN